MHHKTYEQLVAELDAAMEAHERVFAAGASVFDARLKKAGGGSGRGGDGSLRRQAASSSSGEQAAFSEVWRNPIALEVIGALPITLNSLTVMHGNSETPWHAAPPPN